VSRPFLAALRRGLAAALVLVAVALPAGAVTIERVVSPGGIEAWLVRDNTLPVISIQAAFLGGAATDPADKAGLANMVSTLLDEGAGPYDSPAFQRQLDTLATSFRASASSDDFAVSLRTLRINLEPAFELLRLALAEPRFADEPVARMRSEILVSLARKAQDPNTIAARVWRRDAYGDHPYARQIEGTPAAVKAITTDDLHRFMKERIARDVLTIGVVGDIDAETLKPLLDKTFGDLPKASAPVSIPPAVARGNGDLLLVRIPIPQSVVVFGQQGIKRDDPDWYAALIVNYILGGGSFSSRLTEEVRVKRGLAYSVYTYLAPFKHGGLLLGGVATENARVSESIGLIRDEWRRMREAGPTAEELANAKTYLTGSYPLQFDSTGRIAGALVDIQEEKLGIDYLEKRNDYINQVTPEDAKRVARRLLDPDALSFAVVGSPANLKPTKEIQPDGS
jgi:zinc protease